MYVTGDDFMVALPLPFIPILAMGVEPELEPEPITGEESMWGDASGEEVREKIRGIFYPSFVV